ncbi:MAG TPA: hypothetical protein VFW06_10345 [Acidimicrobiia bacterium]|nr:hypothetical protein [Acidimicrobiia bacterium]
MHDLLFPRTDAGVLVQGLVIFPTLIAVLFLVRRDREIRLFVLGLTTLALAWFGIRAVH